MFLRSIADVQIGDVLEHIRIKGEATVVYKGRDYVVIEGTLPHIILSHNIDVYKKVPRVLKNVPVEMLEAAYSIASKDQDLSKSFVEILEQYMQDFKESSIP